MGTGDLSRVSADRRHRNHRRGATSEQGEVTMETRFFGDTFNRFPIWERTLPAVLSDAASRYGSRRFADFPKSPSLTFTDCADLTARAAGGFAALGLNRGDRVAVLSENRAEAVF